MSARFPRNMLRTQSVNVGLVVSLGILGCGEKAQLGVEPEPNGTVGTLRALIASYDDHSETYYRLVKDDGEDLGLNFGGTEPHVRPGERIAVRGRLEGKEIAVSGYDLIQRRIGETRQQLLSGAPEQRTIRVAAISLVSSMSKATFAKRTFMDPDSPAAFYRENSYGAWNLQGEAYGPYTIATTNCGVNSLYTIASEAAAAAKADGFDPNNYDNIMYYITSPFTGCTYGGIAEVGVNEVRGFVNAKHTWYRGNGCVVLAQELGHNYGLLHSHRCTSPPYVNGASYGGTSCPGYDEYGDPNTPMGGGCGHFNSPEMGAMRYISGCNTIAVTSSGTFEIGPIEQKCAGPQVIRVPGNPMANRGQQYIYVEFRRGSGTVGSDTRSPAGLHFYASAEYGGNATGIVADNHDLDYAVDPFMIHAPIGTAGTSWTEPDSGATFRLVTMGQTATVEVTIPSGTGAPQCVGGGTPPASPMCGVVTDGGPPPDSGTGGAGGSTGDASTDVGTGGMSGAGGAAGTAGTAGGGTAGAGGSAGGAAGTAGSAGSAGTGKGGSSGTGGAGAGGTAGTSGTGGTGGATDGGPAGGASGAGAGGSAGATAGSAGSTGSSGRGGSGGTGGSTTVNHDDSGCSCSIPGGNSSTRSPALLVGLSALIPALRRRRTRRTA